LAKYLPQFGWEVTVLTQSTAKPEFPAHIVSTGSTTVSMETHVRAALSVGNGRLGAPVRAALRSVKDLILFPDSTAPWVPRTLRRAYALIASERFDAILSTAMPATVHVVGGLLARHTRLPWIADYRDPWAGNAYVHRGGIRGAMEHALERWLIDRASLITTISEPIADQLRAFHGRSSDVVVIPNAYDPTEWESSDIVEPAGFNLCYTGSMYDGKRSPTLLFHALASLRENGEPVADAARVQFYGPDSDSVDSVAADFGVTQIVERHGLVPRTQALRAQRSAAVLLIFLNMDAATAREMGSKYLEYLGARRPIIVFGPAGSVLGEFIARNGLGWFASNITEARHALGEAYRLYREGRTELTIDPAAFPTAVQLASRFADCLSRNSRGAANTL
jgi:glycosyltransferase involved in cell wall biosynthesis